MEEEGKSCMSVVGALLLSVFLFVVVVHLFNVSDDNE